MMMKMNKRFKKLFRMQKECEWRVAMRQQKQDSGKGHEYHTGRMGGRKLVGIRATGSVKANGRDKARP